MGLRDLRRKPAGLIVPFGNCHPGGSADKCGCKIQGFTIGMHARHQIAAGCVQAVERCCGFSSAETHKFHSPVDELIVGPSTEGVLKLLPFAVAMYRSPCPYPPSRLDAK